MRTAILALLLLTQLPDGGPSRTVTPDDSTAIVQPSPKSPEPYSAVEKLRVENMQLERVIVQRALDDWQKKALALKADLERARPGFIWNPDADTWTAIPKETK
jgi:hypothetical protein